MKKKKSKKIDAPPRIEIPGMFGGGRIKSTPKEETDKEQEKK